MLDIALWFDSRAHLENVQAAEKQMLLWRWFRAYWGCSAAVDAKFDGEVGRLSCAHFDRYSYETRQNAVFESAQLGGPVGERSRARCFAECED